MAFSRRATPASPGRRPSATQAPDPPVLVVLDGRPDRLAPIEGIAVRHVDSPAGLDVELRALWRGVVLIVRPPATGAEIERTARVRTRRIGLRALFLNDPSDAPGRLAALTLGFDEAMPVTVDPDELIGRVTLLAQRTLDDLRDRLPVGVGVELDLTARALRRDGKLVHLRPMEFRLLEELARNAGRPVPRRTLLRRVWGAEDRDGSRTVDVHMRWLRAKVEPEPDRPVHLLTVRGVGYQLELGRETASGAPDEPVAGRRDP